MGTLAAPAARYLVERRSRAEITQEHCIQISYTLRSLDESFGARSLSTFGARAIERWSEQHPHLKPSTRATYLSQIRMFARWMMRRSLIKTDPFADMALPRRPRPSPKPLTREEISAVLSVVPDARARLIVWLQFGLGLRCIGVANLRVEDIDMVNRTLHVIEKGGHERRLPLTNEILAEVDRYLFQFPASSGPLLRNYQRPWQPMDRKYIGKLVVAWMRDAGIKHRAFDGRSSHGLRRTALTELAEACGDAFVVQEVAGWASPATAAHYVKRANTERMRNALERRDAL